jgi:hypothetical protein
VSFSSDEILSFATDIAYALSRPWGKSWTPREVDGCFYYHFHNPKFQRALRNVRQRHLGQEEPPWSSRILEVIFARYGYHPARTLDERLELDYIAEEFGVDNRYLPVTYLTGQPVPFCRYATKFHSDQDNVPILRLDIFSRSIGNDDWNLIRRAYSRSLEILESEKLRAGIDQLVARSEPGRLYLKRQFIDQAVPHIEVLSYPPFASQGIFISAAQEYFDKEKDRLTGRGTAKVAIRAWTGYLLTKLVGKTNRQAIALTNEVLGKQCGTYTMNDVLGQTRGHTAGVTSSGEIQFSNDMAQLVERIDNYDKWLAQADTSWSFIK